MRAIESDMIMTGASTRSDGSLSIRLSTPELMPEEKTAIFELQNRNLKILIQPSDEPIERLIEVKGSLGLKTASQRMRAVLYLEWRQKSDRHESDVLFPEYYEREMSKMIERRKANLDPA